MGWVHRLSNVDVDGRSAICLHCGPVRIKRHGDGWRCVEASRALSKKNPVLARRRRQREALIREQNGRCAICGSEEPLGIDHCHQTLAVRGALCAGCNAGLGRFKDDPSRLRRAIEYLAAAATKPYVRIVHKGRRDKSRKPATTQ